jgi:hypothetical protein
MSKANGPEWGFKSATISKPFESTHDEDLRALHSQGASADITMTRELHGSDVSNTPVGNVDLSTLEGLPEAIARGSASSSPQAVEPIPNIPIRTAGSVQSPSSVTANQAKTAATHGTTGPTASSESCLFLCLRLYHSFFCPGFTIILCLPRLGACVEGLSAIALSFRLSRPCSHTLSARSLNAVHACGRTI